MIAALLLVKAIGLGTSGLQEESVERRVTAQDGERRRPERLSPQDFCNIRVEDSGLPMHVAALVMLGRGGGFGMPTGLGFDALVATIGSRVHLEPRLR